MRNSRLGEERKLIDLISTYCGARSIKSRQNSDKLKRRGGYKITEGTV